MIMLAALAVVLCTTWTVLGFVNVVRIARRARSRRIEPSTHRPPLSVLKPLCGADVGLEKNLESFFTQRYPDYELVFGVQDPHDPATAVVERLRQRYPHVPARLVIHTGGGGINPKVQNLRGMLPHVTHDLVVISDSNVRAPAHYLAELVDTLHSRDDIGLVTNLFVGSGENTVGAALENVQLNGFCAAGAALPTALGDSLVVGKSMLLSRSTFDRLGGFERVADVLAEDYVMGKMFQHAGYGVRIAPTVLENVTSSMTVSAFMQRHLRWGMLRWRLRPAAYVLEPLTSPLAALPLALVWLGPAGFALALGLLMLRDVGGWVALRGFRRAWVPALLSPVREVTMLVVWARAIFKRHIVWRGHRVRLGAGTLLFAATDK